MSDQSKIRRYVDFNSRDQNNDVVLNLTVKEQQDLSTVLNQGCYVILYDETVEIEAKIKWNEEIKMWVATPNLNTIRHLDY